MPPETMGTLNNGSHFGVLTSHKNLPVSIFIRYCLIILLLAAFLLLLSGPVFCAGNRQDYLASVIRVYDGDTLMAVSNGKRIKVRLVGIDAPETPKRGQAGQPFSNKSRKFLKTLVDGKTVTIISFGFDRYQRMLADILVDGESVNLEILEMGLAEAYRGKLPKGLDRKRFLKAEKVAKKASRGIWSLGSQYTPPWKWKQKHPLKKS